MFKEKLIWIDDNLFIEKYDKLCDITNDEILLSNYKIIGNNLEVKSMNKYVIEIKGKIKEIRRK